MCSCWDAEQLHLVQDQGHLCHAVLRSLDEGARSCAALPPPFNSMVNITDPLPPQAERDMEPKLFHRALLFQAAFKVGMPTTFCTYMAWAVRACWALSSWISIHTGLARTAPARCVRICHAPIDQSACYMLTGVATSGVHPKVQQSVVC